MKDIKRKMLKITMGLTIMASTIAVAPSISFNGSENSAVTAQAKTKVLKSGMYLEGETNLVVFTVKNGKVYEEKGKKKVLTNCKPKLKDSKNNYQYKKGILYKITKKSGKTKKKEVTGKLTFKSSESGPTYWISFSKGLVTKIISDELM